MTGLVSSSNEFYPDSKVDKKKLSNISKAFGDEWEKVINMS